MGDAMKSFVAMYLLIGASVGTGLGLVVEPIGPDLVDKPVALGFTAGVFWPMTLGSIVASVVRRAQKEQTP